MSSDEKIKPETNIMHVSDRRNRQQKQTSIVSNGRRSCLSMDNCS
ncbi:hypothetical protein N665_1188s0005 [Sinapis alba]|nr:hypothetical protein N665_1188s0005 [Sinapis alba]